MVEMIPKTIVAAMTTPSGQAAIDAATKRNSRIFAAYIVLLIVSALLIAYFTWLTWDSGNKLQDAIQGDATVRIAEAQKSNLILQGQVATLQTDAAKQQERAAKAEASIALAEQHAAEANAKAEKFRLDIAKANEAAAQAQAQVAGAMAEAAKANLDLERIRTPRSLTNALGLTDSLKMFRGTEYTVIGCFQDQESINFLVQLDKVLADAGWTRVKPAPKSSFGDIQLNISKDFAVPITTRTGVYVGAQSTEPVDELKATPLPLLPAYLRAAMALKGGLASNINPHEGDFGPLTVDPGSSTSVFIIVGKKP
jgi:hypothetical protein